MDFVRLNRVPADASLIEALERIRTGTRGVVVDDKGGSYLVTAEDIMAACNAATDSEKDPASVPIAVARRTGTRTDMPTVPMEAFEKQLRHFFEKEFEPFVPDDLRYALRRLDDQTEFITTASESLQLGQSITICTCVGHPIHRFDKAKLRDPTECNMPHAVAVTCKTI